MDADDWDQRRSSSELIWTAEPNQFLVAEATHLPPGRALDLGAGEGRNAVWLATRGWDVTAVDFSHVDEMAGTDLSVERADCVQRSVATDDGEGTAIDSLVRARLPRR